MKICEIETPAYIIDEKKLRENLEILHSVEERTGAKILLAQKCFSGFCEYPLIGKYISGTTASGLFEARLGKEEMGKENHIFSPAYREKDMEEIAEICDHVVFNSARQLKKFLPVLQGKEHHVSVGIRINPECSTQKDHAIYDPCAPGSRMGVKASGLDDEILNEIEGIHFHTLCEQNSDDLEITLRAVEEKFGRYLRLPHIKWLNMGGGHHITRDGYDLEKLCGLILHMKNTYDVDVYLEPGEAVALDAGYLAATVLDIVKNGTETLILDASAACHMPDVLEMPYQPPLRGARRLCDAAGEIPDMKDTYVYRISSNTCLAGDIIGDYVFDSEVRIGDRLYFQDMAIYTMVKNNTFNGIPLPSIAAMDEDGEVRLVREFSYEDFKRRLS